MKKKTAVFLLAGAMTAGAVGNDAQAMTSGYSWEGKNGTVSYYVTETEMEKQEQRDLEEMEKQEQWHQAEMQEALAYLKDYSVTYDSEQDTIWYQGRKVRCLIDQQAGGGCKTLEMPEGEIDVYTVRNEKFQLTGVRMATQEEFDERTRQDELNKSGEALTIVEVSDIIETSGEDDGNRIHFSAEASDTGSAVVEDEYLAETEEKREEYRKAGISCDDKTGSWIWQGKKVFWLLDEDGSMYQNGEGKEDKIYILVKRNKDGSIQEAKQITAEEILAERILRVEGESD